MPAKAPAANRSESPGKKGITTRPVSAKIIRNKIKYDHKPKECTILARWMLMCKMKSIMLCIVVMEGIIPEKYLVYKIFGRRGRYFSRQYSYF
jgi:hypothetical protein